MIPNRIHVKFFLKEETIPSLPAVVPVFHRWIQDQAVEGLLIDVADYKHVYQGPGIMLVGHEGDYVIDEQDGRPGLQYRRKREWPSEDLSERLAAAVRPAVQARRVLENEPEGYAFYPDELSLQLVDKLRTPNTPAVFESLAPVIEEALQRFFPDASLLLSQATTDPRRPLSINVQLTEPALVSAGSYQLQETTVW